MNANTKEKYDTETKNFEILKYNISDNYDILFGDSCGPDVNFFNQKFQRLDMPYLMPRSSDIWGHLGQLGPR